MSDAIRGNLAPRETAGPAGPAGQPAGATPARQAAQALREPSRSAHSGTALPVQLGGNAPSTRVDAKEADVRFREAGRAQNHERPVAPHLDDRLAGLDQPPRKRRDMLGRRKAAEGMTNEPNDGLRAEFRSPRRIAVVGMKGGVGKTTMSIMTAKAIARARRMPVLLLDSDTTYGSLMLRTGLAPIASAEDLAQMGDPGDLKILQPAVSQTDDGVWVVPSGRTPAQSASFGEKSYVAAVRAVYRHFPVTITDCGAGLAGPLMHRVVSASHCLVIATAPTLDALLASYNTLEWLSSIGYEDLARRSIIAISNVDPINVKIDLAETRKRFAELCGAVIVIPADPHLHPGSVLDYDSLGSATREAAETLAGAALGAAAGAERGPAAH